MSLLSAKSVCKSYGPKEVLTDASLTIEEKDRVGLIGINGAGKSTFLRILTGAVEPDSGEVQRRRGLTVAMVEQTPTFAATDTVEEVIRSRAFAENLAVQGELQKLEATMTTAPEESQLALAQSHADLTAKLQHLGGFDIEHRSDATADALGVPPKNREAGSLSLGEQRRVALTIGLTIQPDLLILDEPTNHLDLGAIEWLENRLRQYPHGLLLITHDRYFLERVSTRIAEIERGTLYAYDGNYTEYMVKKAVRELQEAQAERGRLRAIASEITWVRSSAPARTTKQKARLERFDALVASAPKPAAGQVGFRIPHPARIGKTILEIENISKAYGEKILLSDFSLLLKKGDRIGIVGPNGVGKTTLVRMVLGEVEPDTGSLKQGQNTRLVYADQARADLNPENTVLEEVAGGSDSVWVGEEAVGVHAFLGQLLFDGSTQRTKIAALSGGEKSRVSLAKALRVAGNLLILDEPTNDLDLATLRVLEEAIENYPGCALIVSHDRYFLDRVATSILAFEGNGRATLYEGSYAMYLEKDAARRAQESQESGDRAPAQKAGRASTPKSKKKKRSFKEQREFEQMESQILEAEAEVEALEALVSDPEQICSLGSQISKKLEELETLRGRVEELYSRWSELSEIGP